jgi:UPF0755 protein
VLPALSRPAATTGRHFRVIRILTQTLKIGVIAVLSLAVIFGGVRSFDYYRDQTAAEANIGKNVLVTVKKSDDADAVAEKLEAGGLIYSKTYFKLLVRISGKKLEPASYTLKIGTSTRTIVDLITSEKSVAKTENRTLTITIPEGWRTEQIAEELERLGLNGGAEAFMKAVEGYGNGGFDFLRDRPNRKSLEGYLFPDTYQFRADDPPEDLIQMMLQNFDQKFDEAMRQRADEMGLTIYEVLIFASLVEREAQVSRERPVIAGIYISRLENGIRLDADPTVQYAFGKSGDWWPTPLKEAQLQDENPYNTYKIDGLPPGPIANPGLQSILAALQPVETDYVYFVADPSGDGSHNFAVDPESQAQNVAYLLGETDSPARCSNPWGEGCVLGGS